MSNPSDTQKPKARETGFPFPDLAHMRYGEIEYHGDVIEIAMLNVCAKVQTK